MNSSDAAKLFENVLIGNMWSIFFPAWVLKREREAEEKRQGLLDNNSDKRGALVLF